MIDIIFLLIIFFVVTASFDREQIDSKVSLPAVDSAAVKALPEKRLMINVLPDGSVRAGFHHLAAGEVAEKLGDVIRSMKAEVKKTIPKIRRMIWMILRIRRKNRVSETG